MKVMLLVLLLWMRIGMMLASSPALLLSIAAVLGKA